MKEIAAAFPQMPQETIAAIEASDEYKLALPSGEVVLCKGDYEITSEDMPGWLVASDGPLTLALDITVTDSLRREGTARELINRIQNLRKDNGFEVTDRVKVAVYASVPEYKAEIADALSSFGEYIASQTLSLEVSMAAAPTGKDVEWGDGSVNIDVKIA